MDYKAPSSASWIMKYLCKVKVTLKNYAIPSWNGQYNDQISQVYKMLIGDDHLLVSWAKGVWNRMSPPKQKLILWVGIQNRLKTKEKLFQYGVCAGNKCCIYGPDVESNNHLFYDCV